MSKKILLNILVLFLLTFSVAYAVKIDTINYDGIDYKYTGPEVTLNLNGDKFEVSEGLMPPIILEDRTLVPVREVFETLGGEVKWNAEERRVDVTLGSKEISLWINNKQAEVDGKTVTTDVPAKIINAKTMVPVRFISEQGGLNVSWDPETQTVDIGTPIANVTKVEYSKVDGVKCLIVTAESAISGYKYFMLEEPYRLILDVQNSNFKIDTSIQNIDDDLISTIRFGNQGNDVNRIVLDLKENTDYIVVQSNDKTKLYFAMTDEFMVPGEEKSDNENKDSNNEVLGNITSDNNTNVDNKGDTTSGDNSNIVDNNTTSGDNANSNINDSTASGDDANSNINDSAASGDDVNSNVNDSATSGDNSELKDDNTTSEDKNNINKDDESIKDEDKNDNNSSDDDKKELDDDQKIIVPDVYITSIKYSSISKRIKVIYDGDIEYSDMFLSNPNRIVIDIANAELKTEGPKEINLKNNIVTGIRFSQYEEDTVRIVLDLDEKVDYKIYKRSSELQISVTQPTYKNVTYKNNVANSQITLLGVDKDDITVSRNENKNRYTLRFSSSDFDCGEGEINPEDAFVDSINITETKITIYDTGDMVYTMRQSGSNVVITVKKENEESDNIDKKIILIDAGHGGNDPGACNGTAQEKVYNFNIASMLYDLLSERDDVEVYMTRDSDIYLDREDRLEIATKINPDLIVSVHNNSLENKSYTGTMVLYYNNDTESQFGDITSKECAQIVQNKLVDALGTVNRGVVSRQDLHILSKTPCPSILCEICFISNDAELERLKTKSFQEDAAEAIYDGVVEILEIM